MFNYLIAVSLYWLGLGALYFLLLRKEKFFHLNRFYLLGILLAGLLFPMLDFSSPVPPPEWAGSPILWLETVTVGMTQSSTEAETWSWTEVLWVLYASGCLIALVRLTYCFHQLIRQIQRGPLDRIGGITKVQTQGVQTPFSWFHFLFWSQDLNLAPEEQAIILAHEKAHIQQGHSYDVLLLEIIGVFFWWNPLWYALRAALREVHEFLADAAALQQTPVRQYGHILIRQSLSRPRWALVQPFHSSTLKQRITMMTKPSSSPLALLKYLLLLPVGLLLFWACENAEDEVQEVAASIQYAPAFQQVDTVVTFDPATQQESTQIVKSDVYRKVEQMPLFGTCGDKKGQELNDCSSKNLLTYVYENVTYPAEAKDAGEEGMAVVQFIVDTQGQPYGAEVIRSSESASIDAEALRIVNNLPKFQSGMIDGKPVQVQLLLPIRFVLE